MLSCGFDGHGGAITSVRHSRRPIASGLAWSETWPAFGYAARRRNRECDREGGTSRVTLRGHAVKGYLRISQRPGSRLGQLVRRSGDVVHAVPTRRVTIRRSHDRLVLTGLPALRSGAGRPPIRHPARDGPDPLRPHIRGRGCSACECPGGIVLSCHAFCRDGDGQTPGSPWQKPAPSIAASQQRNLAPWPMSLRDDAIQQDSSPAATRHSSRGKNPKPLRCARGVD